MLHSIYLVTYRHDDNEVCVEVPAYSLEQAIYLSPCNPEDIISTEITVSKTVAAGA